MTVVEIKILVYMNVCLNVIQSRYSSKKYLKYLHLNYQYIIFERQQSLKYVLWYDQ